MSNRLLHSGALNFSKSFTELNPGDDSVLFSSQIQAAHGNRVAIVNVDADLMVEDDGTFATQELLYTTVAAWRTLPSAALGAVTAIAWLEISGGELTGTGLDFPCSRRDIDHLIGKFKSPPSLYGSAAVERLGRLVTGPGTNMQFS